jgi:hypothetical protein
MENKEAVELQDVVLAFQKAMARAAQATARAVAETPAMRYGTRQVYAVQRLEVELPVEAEVRRTAEDGGETERVVVRFDPAPERAARLRFAVDAAPPGEALQEAGLFLGTPRVVRDGETQPSGVKVRPGDRVEISAAVYSALGAPVPAAAVSLEVTTLAEESAADPAAPDELRWIDAAPEERWLRPELTDARGTALLAFIAPASAGALLRIRGRASVPAGTGDLHERKPVFLAVERTGAPMGYGRGPR